MIAVEAAGWDRDGGDESGRTQLFIAGLPPRHRRAKYKPIYASSAITRAVRFRRNAGAEELLRLEASQPTMTFGCCMRHHSNAYIIR